MNFQMPLPLLFGTLVIFETATLGADAIILNSRMNETCATETKELDIVRQTTVSHGGATITVNCVGTIMVNECDGECLSKVAPSVLHFPELEKECKCCKEGSIIQRTVTLRECSNGNNVIRGVTTTAQIREPINCSCQSCRN